MDDAQSKTSPLRIEKLIYGGAGLARQDNATFFVPLVLPGEEVTPLNPLRKKGIVEADPGEIHVFSPERVVPPCDVFGDCGGCHYQHANYPYQLAQKKSILIEMLARMAKIEPPGEVDVVSGEPWGYRNRSQFHIQHGRVGFRARGSSALVRADSCPISSPAINKALAALSTMARDQRRFPRFLKSLEFFSDERTLQVNVGESDARPAQRFFDWIGAEMENVVSGALDYAAAGFQFRVSYQSFFQVNRFLVDKLVDIALADAEGRVAVDLYAGVGLFSLPLAKKFAKVTAVESGRAAMRDLKFNSERARVSVRCVSAQSESFLPDLEETPDFLVADPPRSGLDRKTVDQLLRLKAPRVNIVSCDPATLARDLVWLLAGGYELKKVTLIDLFPQTFHIETVVQLALK